MRGAVFFDMHLSSVVAFRVLDSLPSCFVGRTGVFTTFAIENLPRSCVFPPFTFHFIESIVTCCMIFEATADLTGVGIHAEA